eukprot:12042035-Prorocentrum_lima.AAC.1
MMQVTRNTHFRLPAHVAIALRHASKSQLLIALRNAEVLDQDVLLGRVDQEDQSVLRVAASLYAWKEPDSYEKMILRIGTAPTST